MARYNVNAARAQRLEALGQRWEFDLDDDVFSLPTELPRSIVHRLGALDPSDLDGLLELLLGEEQFKRFAEHETSVQDIQALLEAYGKDTGMPLGNPRPRRAPSRARRGRRGRPAPVLRDRPARLLPGTALAAADSRSPAAVAAGLRGRQSRARRGGRMGCE